MTDLERDKWQRDLQEMEILLLILGPELMIFQSLCAAS